MAGNQQEELLALMEQSRKEQATIAAKIATLRGDTPQEWTPVGQARQVAKGGGESVQEVSALRGHIAEMDFSIAERDSEIESLRDRIAGLQQELSQSQPPRSNVSWQEKYELERQSVEARVKIIAEMRVKRADTDRELRTLTALVESTERKKEEQAKVLHEEEKDFLRVRKSLQAIVAERQRLDAQADKLRESFVRCVGRANRALAAGILNVSIGGCPEEVAFATLRSADRDGWIIELFEDPDSASEFAAVSLSAAAGAAVSVSRSRWELHVRGAGGGNALQIRCANHDDFLKWLGALHFVGLLPQTELDAARTRI
eukprot:TRINITY_DN20184_c0_g1_i1.p1 TRINITY_DN20184_c0_g1~~TRINITY_DN20184_c0_g1_i1.p1  ORF type:complete len:337 (-),score=56.96 TRINITY_DN20184_c0_g1_i1:25-972(-)